MNGEWQEIDAKQGLDPSALKYEIMVGTERYPLEFASSFNSWCIRPPSGCLRLAEWLISSGCRVFKWIEFPEAIEFGAPRMYISSDGVITPSWASREAWLVVTFHNGCGHFQNIYSAWKKDRDELEKLRSLGS